MEFIKASFYNISQTLENNIINSKKQIDLCVAWFTNKELLGFLVDKVKEGVKVNIIISDDIINKRLNRNEFLNSGGTFNILQSDSSKFLHEKFAIFDNQYLITGSYNWTYFAEYKNHESIVILNNTNLVKQYEIRFKKLNEFAISFKFDALVNEHNLGADIAEKEFEGIEKSLENEFLFALNESKKIHAKINFDFVYTFLKSYGAIGASKRLMRTGTENIQSGFIKMWELGRIDLTFEYIISQDKYKFLFDKKTIMIAKERLDKFKNGSR